MSAAHAGRKFLVIAQDAIKRGPEETYQAAAEVRGNALAMA